jgi:uncharacterized protein YndB with AHSA1/START domain
MKKWYFDIAKFKPEVGFEFEFYGGKEDVQYHHLCKILELIPQKKLSYSWRYEKEKGSSILTFVLVPEGNKTKLTLTHSGLETFPQDKPDFAKASFNEGWNYIINTSLKNYLEG